MNRGQFAHALQAAVGLEVRLGSLKTRRRTTFMLAWMRGEFGSHPCNGVPGEGARFNPLATTHPFAGATPYNTFGDPPMHVMNYPTAGSGVIATADTLTNGRYQGILDALGEGRSAEDMARALIASPWGTGDNAMAALPYVRAHRRQEYLRPIGAVS